MSSESRQICEVAKNFRETLIFRLGQYNGHKYCDMRIFITEPEGEGRKESPTKKGLAVSPALWPQFKEALAQVEAAMIADGWLDRADLEPQG